MRKYHIIFKTKDSDFMSKGENFEAESPIGAIGAFQFKYPEAQFIAAYDLDTLNDIKGGRKDIDSRTVGSYKPINTDYHESSISTIDDDIPF